MFYLMLGVALVTASSTWIARGHWDAGEVAQARADIAEEKASALAEAANDRKWADVIAGRFEGKLSKLRVTNTTINNEVRHETEKVVYGNPECDVPASGVMLINQSVLEANRAAGYVQTEVPARPAASDKGGRPSNDGRPIQPR